MPPPSKKGRGHLNDFTCALGQQMFFWGRDVLAGGNLLVRHGFAKHASSGLQGTSCYCKVWREGVIELHGACAGWYPAVGSGEGLLFIRHDRRCYYHHQHSPVVPGHYDYTALASGKTSSLLQAGRRFAAWLADYETWVTEQMGPDYRSQCHAMFCKLPASRSWLPPDVAQQWLQAFAQGDPSLPRARHWLHR